MNAQEIIAIAETDALIRESKTYSKNSNKCVNDIPLMDAFEDHQPQSNLFTRIKMNNGLLYYPNVCAGQYVCYYCTKHIHYPLTDQSYPTAEEAVLTAAKNWEELRTKFEITSPLKLKVFCVKEDFIN